MKKFLLAIAGGLMVGALVTSHAKLPAPPPLSDAEKAAAADKAAAAKAKEAELNSRAQDKAVANYRKNKGMPMDSKPAAMGTAKAAAKK